MGTAHDEHETGALLPQDGGAAGQPPTGVCALRQSNLPLCARRLARAVLAARLARARAYPYGLRAGRPSGADADRGCALARASSVAALSAPRPACDSGARGLRKAWTDDR